MFKKIMAGLVTFGSAVALRAQSAGSSVPSINGENGLWSKLGIDFGTYVEQCFQAMATPLGIVIVVMLTMCIFYLAARLLGAVVKGRSLR